ncbi:hypothetical protein ZIOFF_068901 [Zingiber officinale]|uniref:Uncharacterized protein n=1 Tax=Zingiber officinale TaxID=94328 RepID=A0A8J5CD07_ZINOF|nr:hypothetical protein ZIOFF_068901 [Zingiber officinale]
MAITTHPPQHRRRTYHVCSPDSPPNHLRNLVNGSLSFLVPERCIMPDRLYLNGKPLSQSSALATSQLSNGGSCAFFFDISLLLLAPGAAPRVLSHGGESRSIDLVPFAVYLMFFNCFFEQSVSGGQLQPRECQGKCAYRCSATSHKKPCMFFCLKCCAKCLCVPPGTYGNKETCACYNNWKTQEGRPKCP